MIPELPSPSTPVAEGSARPMGRVWKQWLQGFRRSVAGRLVPTAVQTEDYGASDGELVLVDPSDGALTVSFPTDPGDGARVGYKNVTTDTTGVTMAPGSGVTVDGASSATQTSVRTDPHTEYVFCKARQEWVS